MIEGGLQAKDKWQGIHISGGSSYFKTSFVMVYKNKWSLWKSTEADSESGSDLDSSNSSEGDVFDEPIIEKEVLTDKDEDNSDSGALINIDERIGKYAKIRDNNVCYLVITNNKCNWLGKCVPVTEDKNNYPQNTIAAIKARSMEWYYFNREGKYCKRADKSNAKVNTFR